MDSSLIHTLESASGGSRELDAELWDLIDPRPREDIDGHGRLYKRDPADSIAFDAPPPFTTSLDAVLALVERVLPGWHWNVSTEPDGKGASAWVTSSDWQTSGEQFAKTPPLALLCALLKALPHE